MTGYPWNFVVFLSFFHFFEVTNWNFVVFLTESTKEFGRQGRSLGAYEMMFLKLFQKHFLVERKRYRGIVLVFVEWVDRSL